MLNGKLDATRVCVESRLVGISADRVTTRCWNCKTGNSRLHGPAREKANGLLSGLLPGSQLELTGVYMGQGGDRAASRDIDSFELLLNSPSGYSRACAARPGGRFATR